MTVGASVSRVTVQASLSRVVPSPIVSRLRRGRLVRRAQQLRRRLDTLDIGTEATGWADVYTAFPEFHPFQRFPELLVFLRMVHEQAPARVCEIGTAAGGLLCALARTARPDAVLVAVDLQITPERQAAFGRFASDAQRIVCVDGDSHDAAVRDRVREALDGQPLDLLVIDGDHAYDGVRRDFELYRPLVRPDGLIVFHDIVPDHQQRYGTPTNAQTGGVPRFWASLRTHPRAFDIIEDPSQDGYGIGVLLGHEAPSLRRPPGNLDTGPTPSGFTSI